MAVSTYTKTGNKATTPAKLDKAVFGMSPKSHELLKQAYVAYLANGRENLAITKKRGEVRGGGRKPWRQKGTGRARVGSTRSPIWRSGGITFGPTGEENFSNKLSSNAKRQALRQALSLAADEGKIIIIESFGVKDAKTSNASRLLEKLNASGRILIAVDNKLPALERALGNMPKIKLVQSSYLNVYDIVNADYLIISTKGLEAIHEWLGAKK